MIEAEGFYEYIEEEQKSELLDFILSTCPAKSIYVGREEIKEVGGETHLNAEMLKAKIGIKHKNTKTPFISIKGRSGFIQPRNRTSYVWLEESVMLGINALREGSGTFEKTYIKDFTFGLTANEAKLIGVDMTRYKKYKYIIKVEC